MNQDKKDKLKNMTVFYGITIFLFAIFSYILSWIYLNIAGLYVTITTIFYIIIIMIFLKKPISKFTNGIRYRNYCIMDTGETGYTILSKNLDSCIINDQVLSVNLKNSVGSLLFFSEDIAENLKVEYNNNKAEFYQNSNEFNTLFNNKILEQFMYLQAKNIIKIILVISVFILIIDFYLIYIGNKQFNDIANYLSQFQVIGK